MSQLGKQIATAPFNAESLLLPDLGRGLVEVP